MTKEYLPKVSIILPTYNNEKTLKLCLEGISMQTYKNYEILIIDGNSTDSTVKIAEEFKCKIINNPFRIEERGRVIGIQKAKGDILCFIDADNYILDSDWLRKMVEPFSDKEIVASDTLFYTYRKNDNLVTKYCSLIGGDDPIAIYLGLFDRFNYFKNNWTGFPYKIIEKKENYTKVKLDKEKIPAMGSNGFLYRKNMLNKINYEPFVHTDVIYKLVNAGYNNFAKVNTDLVHYFFGIKDFFKKKIRRLRRRATNTINIQYKTYGLSKFNIIKTIIYLLLIFPVIYHTIKGFVKKPTIAWILHPFLTYATFILYVYYFTIGRLIR